MQCSAHYMCSRDYGLRFVSPFKASFDTYLRAVETFLLMCFHFTHGKELPTDFKNAIFRYSVATQKPQRSAALRGLEEDESSVPETLPRSWKRLSL